MLSERGANFLSNNAFWWSRQRATYFAQEVHTHVTDMNIREAELNIIYSAEMLVEQLEQKDAH